MCICNVQYSYQLQDGSPHNQHFKLKLNSMTTDSDKYILITYVNLQQVCITNGSQMKIIIIRWLYDRESLKKAMHPLHISILILVIFQFSDQHSITEHRAQK